jgi:hypothetical protein
LGKSAFIRREVFLNECAAGRSERATPAYFRLTFEIIAFTLILLELRRVEEFNQGELPKQPDILSY